MSTSVLISSTSLPSSSTRSRLIRRRRYLNSKGIIPQTAVFKKGENPEKTRLPAGAPVVEGEAPKEEAEEVVVEGEEEG